MLLLKEKTLQHMGMYLFAGSFDANPSEYFDEDEDGLTTEYGDVLQQFSAEQIIEILREDAP